MSNQTLNTEKSENQDLPKVTNDNVNIATNKEKNEEKTKKEIKVKTNDNNVDDTAFSITNFFIYKITFGKRKKKLKIFDNFRKSIISVEHLMENYLKLNDLLKLEKRRSKTKN